MRKSGANGTVTREAIQRESLALIYKYGFEAASMRKLAQKVGVRAGSLYNYFRTKEDLLTYIMKSTLEQRIARLDSELAHANTPYEALVTFVRTGVQLNTKYRQETIIGDREMGRLPKQVLNEVIRLRDDYDHRLTDIIDAGVASGAFVISDARIGTFAIVGMLSRISVWYKSAGRLSQADLEDLYVGFALRIVGAEPPAQPEKKPAEQPAAAKSRVAGELSQADARRKASRRQPPRKQSRARQEVS